MAEDAKKSSSGMILFAWLLVGIPLSWGVYNTVLNSQKLFQNAPPPATAPATPAK